MTLKDISIKSIVSNPHQPRTEFDPTALQELANSIKEHGIIQPLIVVPDGRPDRYVLLAGERRWRAAQLAQLETVPAVIKEKVDERTMAEIALIENVQRENLSAIEEARGYEQLARQFDLSDVEIGQRVGKSRSTIANLRRLLKLPKSVGDLIGSGEGQLPQRFARDLVTVANLVPETRLLDTAKKIAVAPNNGQEEPEELIEDLVDAVSIELPQREICWDLTWLSTPVVVNDTEGSLEVRDCKGCPFFIASARRCASKRCFTAKLKLHTEHEVERIVKKTGIPLGLAEQVTLIEIDWTNEAKVKRWIGSGAKHLRLLPGDPNQPGYYQAQELLGSPYVRLATTTPAVLADKEKQDRSVPQHESDTAKTKRLAEEERERKQRRKEQSEARKARADVTWLVQHTAVELAPKLGITGGALLFADEFIRQHSRWTNSEWPEVAQTFSDLDKQCQASKNKTATLEPLIRQRILLYRLVDAVNGYAPKETFNWSRALNRVERVAEQFDLKLPRGWNQPPIHKTEANCWHCGKFAPLPRITKRDVEEDGWSAHYRDGKTLDISCGDHRNKKK